MSSHVSSWHPLDGVLTTNGARVPRLDHSMGTDDAPVFFLLIWRVHHLSAGGRCNDAPPKFRSQGPGCILISSLLPTTGPMVAASWSSTALSSRPQDWRAEAGEEGTDYADPLFLTEPEPGWAQRETSSRHWSPFHFRVSCCPSRTLRRSYSYSFCLIGFFSLCEHHPWVAAWRGAGPIWALSFHLLWEHSTRPARLPVGSLGVTEVSVQSPCLPRLGAQGVSRGNDVYTSSDNPGWKGTSWLLCGSALSL